MSGPIGGIPFAKPQGLQLPSLPTVDEEKGSELAEIKKLIDTKLFVLAKQVEHLNGELRERDRQIQQLQSSIQNSSCTMTTLLTSVSTSVQTVLQAMQSDQHNQMETLKRLENRLQEHEAAIEQMAEQHTELLVMTAKANGISIPGMDASDDE